MSVLNKKQSVKKFTKFRPELFSRHPSHSCLRREKQKTELLPFRSLIRMGSTTKCNKDRVECNTIEAVIKSSNKLLMKTAFKEFEVKTANWFIFDSNQNIFLEENSDNGIPMLDLPFPIIAKHVNGSRGTGNYKLDTLEDLQEWMEGKNLNKYIFEKFYSYSKEYRLHVTQERCFYTCRKMLKSETPENDRWRRHDDNSVWILETNSDFDKPTNWDEIVEHSIKALKSVGLDIGAVDLKVQSSYKNDGSKRKNIEFIILETNSAPSFGEITEQKYLEEIPKVLKNKYNQQK
jgi:carbamoylphosphate synthase large subunit